MILRHLYTYYRRERSGRGLIQNMLFTCMSQVTMYTILLGINLKGILLGYYY